MKVLIIDDLGKPLKYDAITANKLREWYSRLSDLNDNWLCDYDHELGKIVTDLEVQHNETNA